MPFDQREVVVLTGETLQHCKQMLLPIIRTDAGGFFGFGEHDGGCEALAPKALFGDFAGSTHERFVRCVIGRQVVSILRLEVVV